MKNTRRLALVFCLFAATASQAQVANPDTMVHKLFASLKAKDEKAYVALYPNNQQMARLMRGVMENMFKSPEMQQMMASDSNSKNLNIDSLIDAQMAQVTKPEAQAEMEKGFAKSFHSIIEKGEKKGINWSDVQFVSVQFDSSKQDPEMQMLGGSGMRSMNGVVDFTAGGTAYQMNFEKMVYLPAEGSWFGGEFKQVVKKGEAFAKDEPEEDATATVGTTKPKTTTKKTTTKTTTKTKTKTQTAAGKTKTKTKS